MARKKQLTLSEARAKCVADFPHYAETCLRIRTKAGQIARFRLNEAQLHIHARAQDQLDRTGKVRLIILKGRQQGISTYVEARAYWRTTTNMGWRSFILTHLAEATENLFTMAKRFHEHCPDAMRPTTTSDSGKRLVFGALDSDYAVGTAGTQATGRGSTIQLFHGSEVAFWPHADEHSAGIMQAVPDAAGTEVYLESTANGVGNEFHQSWQRAVAGQGDFEAVFIPWFWQKEYRRPAPGFSRDDDEDDLANRFGLDDDQLNWRRHKLIELNGDVHKFRREYPNDAAEAFSVSGDRAFFDAGDVETAQQVGRTIEPVGPKIMACDPARFGDDRTAVALRQGRLVSWVKHWSKADTMDTVGRLKLLIDEHDPVRVFVDVIGLGAGVVDRLKEMGYRNVTAASASATSLAPDMYLNKRHEMYGELKLWLKDQPAQLPNDIDLAADLAAITIKRYDSKGRVQLETKDETKSRGVMSPDLGDAVALTFYEPVAMPQVSAAPLAPRVSGGWMG